MKTHNPFNRSIVIATLLLAGILPSLVFAQTQMLPVPTVGKSVEKQEPAPEQANAAGSDNSTAQAKEEPKKTPAATEQGENVFLRVWNLFKPELLWKENGLIDWACLLGYIFAGMVLGKIISILLNRAASRREGTLSKCFSDMAGPANLFIVTLGISTGIRWLKLSKELGEFSGQCIQLIFSAAVFWYLYNVIGLIDPLLHHLSRNSDSALDKQVAPLVRRTLRVFLIILTLMYVFKVFGADIGAWLAGLGIAGIAVSLAAQDSLKNLFGSITIILDRPFKIGDRIICTGYEGVIEDIGFRSTKVRTTAGHLVSIPNANIVNSPIENISRRPGIRRNFTLMLTPDTTAEKARQATELVRELLESKEFGDLIHPHCHGLASPPQVTLNDIIGNNPTLSITFWFAPARSAEYPLFCERLNLRILEDFEKAGIRLAAKA
jgi:MscS family membrane protein